MMKGSMIVCLFFLLGCLIGFGAHIQLDTHNLSMYILYVLMFQVGINIGSNENLKGMLAHFTPKMLIIPLVPLWRPPDAISCCSRPDAARLSARLCPR